MDCCNGNIIDLGCFYSCDLIQTGETATATGVYTLALQPDGTRVVSNTITSGNPIIFSGGYLNEDSVSVFKVIKPDGTYLTVSGADCFEVDIKPASNPDLANGECTAEAACDTTYNVYVGGVLRATGTIDCSVNNTINIYPS